MEVERNKNVYLTGFYQFISHSQRIQSQGNWNTRQNYKLVQLITFFFPCLKGKFCVMGITFGKGLECTRQTVPKDWTSNVLLFSLCRSDVIYHCLGKRVREEVTCL